MNVNDFPVPLAPEIARNVEAALAEDLGAGDLTAELVPAANHSTATVIVREPAVVCGIPWFNACFAAIDPDINIQWHVAEGDHVGPESLLCELQGPSRALLSGERAALNFLQLLSGVATRTATFVNTIAGTPAQIVDTRKTIPGLRVAQKYAVRVGGGGNHRLALWDAILIKENHILAAGGIKAAIKAAQVVAEAHASRCRFIQVEVESIAELDDALSAGANFLLLDNFDLAMMREGVSHRNAWALKTGIHARLEASGGVRLETVRLIAETGIDRISIGGLTKDVRAIDLSMRFKDLNV
jgi:nicotinate-nucleotide pyrophosphorylase (carboxylating)